LQLTLHDHKRARKIKILLPHTVFNGKKRKVGTIREITEEPQFFAFPRWSDNFLNHLCQRHKQFLVHK
jgi:hypothetical protein